MPIPAVTASEDFLCPEGRMFFNKDDACAEFENCVAASPECCPPSKEAESSHTEICNCGTGHPKLE